MTTPLPVVLPAQPILRFDAVASLAASHGIVPASADDLPEMRDLAERLMNHKVASMEAYVAVQAVQPPAILVYREDGRMTGVFGRLFLREEGVRQLLDDRFDALDVDCDLLSREGERPAAMYAWGVACETRAAGVAILGGAGAIRSILFPVITAFTRAVTGAGRHVAMTRYGFRGLRHADDDLMVSEPKFAEAAA